MGVGGALRWRGLEKLLLWPGMYRSRADTRRTLPAPKQHRRCIVAKKSPHWRGYNNITVRPSKIDYSQEGEDTRWIERIALLNEYVEHDDGAQGRELCMRSLCVRPTHSGKCVAPRG